MHTSGLAPAGARSLAADPDIRLGGPGGPGRQGRAERLTQLRDCLSLFMSMLQGFDLIAVGLSLVDCWKPHSLFVAIADLAFTSLTARQPPQRDNSGPTTTGSKSSSTTGQLGNLSLALLYVVRQLVVFGWSGWFALKDVPVTCVRLSLS
jgi:hypothetical protein